MRQLEARATVQADETRWEDAEEEEEDYLLQPLRHSRIPLNRSKVTAREVVVCERPWAGQREVRRRGGGGLEAKERENREGEE